MYRVNQNTVPFYIQNMFQYNNNSERNLRSSNDLNFVIPKPNKELFKGSMSYSGAQVWNSTPVCIRLCPTIKSFTVFLFLQMDKVKVVIFLSINIIKL